MRDKFDSTLAQFGLTGQVHDDLVQVGQTILPMLDAVLTQFYKDALNDPRASRFLADEHTRNHARKSQEKHWHLLLSGSFCDDYVASTNRVGRVHNRIQLPMDVYLAGYARASTQIQAAIVARVGPLATRRRRRQLANHLGALTRTFALDSFLVMDAYFGAQREEQAKALTYLTAGIGRLSNRDLSQPIPGPGTSDFPARFDAVRQKFNDCVASFSQLMTQIQTATEQLTRNATDISASSKDLAKRTETQAATLEQTAAAVQEIAASQKSSTEATAKTDEVVRDTRKSAEQGGEVVRNAVQKMNEIEDSSSKISSIIEVIDDIAFQTNLLALNAGVEAARAGEAGRGFAVVASEVRGLAQRAADSAKEIKELISTSSGHVKNGVILVSDTGKALTDVVTNVAEVSDLTANIVAAAKEQSNGFGEINLGVSHLDQVTQQNAAMVEEVTAAIVAMQTDMQSLSQLVGSFKIAAPDAGSDVAGMQVGTIARQAS